MLTVDYLVGIIVHNILRKLREQLGTDFCVKLGLRYIGGNSVDRRYLIVSEVGEIVK